VLPNRGRLNWVIEKAGVASGRRLEPGTEASKGPVRKRKSYAGARPAGKQIKVAEKKKAAAPKIVAALKGVGAASSRAASVPPKAAPKAGAPPRAAAQKAAAMKTIAHAASGTVGCA
jgi:hypothetical protein